MHLIRLDISTQYWETPGYKVSLSPRGKPKFDSDLGQTVRLVYVCYLDVVDQTRRRASPWFTSTPRSLPQSKVPQVHYEIYTMNMYFNATNVVCKRGSICNARLTDTNGYPIVNKLLSAVRRRRRKNRSTTRSSGVADFIQVNQTWEPLHRLQRRCAVQCLNRLKELNEKLPQLWTTGS